MNFARAAATLETLPRVKSHEISRAYKRRIVEDRTPVSASIELTMRCNLHCEHCYCPPGDRKAELSTDEIKALFDRMAEMGTLFLLMTGGDPLLRKDFPELYRYAKELGLLVTVFTNGTLIDDRIAALWEELPPYLVEISLYGITRETYEKVVSVKGSFDRCLAGIHRVLAAGHPLALKAPATKDNVHEIPEMQAFANDLGVEFRYDPVILATMDGDKRPHELRIEPEEIVALESSDPRKDRAWRDWMADEARPTPASNKLFSCGAGKNSFHVDPYGNVQVCLMVKNFKHSLREQSLDEIYFDDFPEILALERDEGSKCGSCALRSSCNNCPGMALWETQDNHSHVDFACSLSQVRAKSYPGALRDAVSDANENDGEGAAPAGQGPLLQIGGLGGGSR